MGFGKPPGTVLRPLKESFSAPIFLILCAPLTSPNGRKSDLFFQLAIRLYVHSSVSPPHPILQPPVCLSVHPFV